MNDMSSQIIHIDVNQCSIIENNEAWIKALESGKVLHFINLPFEISSERRHY